MDIADVEVLADGRIFTGEQAKDVLLIDEIGDLQDAIKLAADMSGIKDPPKVIEPSRPFSFREFLSNRFFGKTSALPLQTGVHLLYLMAF